MFLNRKPDCLKAYDFLYSNLDIIDWEICKIINSTNLVDVDKVYEKKYPIPPECSFTELDWHSSIDPTDEKTTMLWLAMNKGFYITDKNILTIINNSDKPILEKMPNLNIFYNHIKEKYKIKHSWIHINHIGQKLYKHKDENMDNLTPILFFRDLDTRFYVEKNNQKFYNNELKCLTFDKELYHGIDEVNKLTWVIVLRVEND